MPAITGLHPTHQSLPHPLSSPCRSPNRPWGVPALLRARLPAQIFSGLEGRTVAAFSQVRRPAPLAAPACLLACLLA